MNHREPDWRKRNPYGVGYSSEDIVQRTKTCPCCLVEFAWKGPREVSDQDHRCPHCETHRDSSAEDELTKLREHDARLRGLVDTARKLTREARRDLELREHMDTDRARQVASALASRQRARERLQAVEELHPPGAEGGCGCGSRGCNVAQTIEDVRRRQRDRDEPVYDIPDFDEWRTTRRPGRSRREPFD